jgi:hypothetical protein
MRLDMTSREWAELVTPVLPHVLADADLPQLGHVRIEVGEHAVYAVATDRYTLAAERRLLEDRNLDVIPPLHIRATEVAVSLKLFPYGKDSDPELRIVIDRAPFPITVVGQARSIDRWAITIEAPDQTRIALFDHRDPSSDPMANWRLNLTKALIRDYDHAAPALTLNGAYFARWAKAVRKGERLSVFTGREGNRPVLLAVEDHFLGAWMPISYLESPAEQLARTPWLGELDLNGARFDPETGALKDDADE